MMAEHNDNKTPFMKLYDKFSNYKRYMDNTQMGKMKLFNPVTGPDSWQDLKGSEKWDFLFGPQLEPVLEEMEIVDVNTKPMIKNFWFFIVFRNVQ